MAILARTGTFGPNHVPFLDWLRDHFLFALDPRTELEATTVGQAGAATLVFVGR